MIRLLLIEDDEANRLTIAALLEDEGIAVIEASSCAEARQVVASDAAWDVAVVDRRLGDGDGLGLVSMLRSARPGARIALWTGDPEPQPGANASSHVGHISSGRSSSGMAVGDSRGAGGLNSAIMNSLPAT